MLPKDWLHHPKVRILPPEAHGALADLILLSKIPAESQDGILTEFDLPLIIKEIAAPPQTNLRFLRRLLPVLQTHGFIKESKQELFPPTVVRQANQHRVRVINGRKPETPKPANDIELAYKKPPQHLPPPFQRKRNQWRKFHYAYPLKTHLAARSAFHSRFFNQPEDEFLLLHEHLQNRTDPVVGDLLWKTKPEKIPAPAWFISKECRNRITRPSWRLQMSIEAINWALKQPIKEPGSTLLLIVMANYASEQFYCTASYKTLMKLGRIASRTTLRKKLKQLGEQGFITKYPRVNQNGGSESNAYQLMVENTSHSTPLPPPKSEPQQKPKMVYINYPDGLNVAAWNLWTDYKAEQFKDSYKSPRSELIACKKLIELANSDHDTQLAIVEQSVANIWKGLFALQENRHEGQKNQADWRAGLAEIFSETETEPEGEIIIDADYLPVPDDRLV